MRWKSASRTNRSKKAPRINSNLGTEFTGKNFYKRKFCWITTVHISYIIYNSEVIRLLFLLFYIFSLSLLSLSLSLCASRDFSHSWQLHPSTDINFECSVLEPAINYSIHTCTCISFADGEGEGEGEGESEGEKECSRTTYHDPPVLEQRALHASAFGVNILSTLFYPPFQRRATSSLLSPIFCPVHFISITVFTSRHLPIQPSYVYFILLQTYQPKTPSISPIPLSFLPDLEQLHFARQIKCVVLRLQLEVRGLCPETLNDLVVLMLGS